MVPIYARGPDHVDTKPVSQSGMSPVVALPLPWRRHVEILSPRRPEFFVELTGKDQKPIGSGSRSIAEYVTEFGNPFRPCLSPRIVGSGVGGFPERDND